VIIPTYNERENLPFLVAMLFDELGGMGQAGEVVVVDDGSPDGTADVARQLQTAYGRDKVVLRERSGKLGLGTAYLEGLGAATGPWVVLMDADMSHDPRYLRALIDAQREAGADVVTGTRYRDGGGVAGWSVKRKLISNGANVLAKNILLPGLSDLTGSYRLYRRSALENVLSQVSQAK